VLFGSVALPTEQVAAQGELAPPSNNASLNVPGIAELGYNPRYVTPATPAGYGQTIASYASGSLPTPWKYQGRLDVSPDSANPLYEAGARYYSPAIGAFTQLDSYAGSAQNPLSLNRYLYAGANPTSFVDPDGHAFGKAIRNNNCDAAGGVALSCLKPPSCR
jgi:RHS repeat-associated protein